MALSSTIVAVLTVAVLVAAIRVAEGQSDCAAQLVPCAAYLNSTNPSTECCTAIRQVVSTQLQCLCRLYKNRQALSGINITQALLLPTYCNISNDVNPCNDLARGSSSQPPPGVPGRDENAGSMTALMGMPTLFLVSALTFLYLLKSLK